MTARVLIVCSGLALLSALAGFGQKASGPTTQPILRIGTETHTTYIEHMDIDADGRYILTASGDKTARLWDAEDGKLLRVMRPPIDMEREGQLYACALSPDGRLAAVAGSTGFHWSTSGSIYVFDTSTSMMVRNVRGFPSAIGDLEFSLNGRYLAVALWKGGVRIVDTSSWQTIHSLRDYSEACRSVSFDRTGRLAAASFDGTVRLYDASFQTSRVRKADPGRRPSCVALTSDGSRIAVGYEDSNRLEVLSGEDLELLYRPESRGFGFEAHFCVCWSRDGEFLYAGGWYGEDRDGVRWNSIEKWSAGGRVRAQTYPASTDTVFDLRMLPDGSILYCSAPDVGRMDQAGESVFVRRRENCQLNNQRGFLRISADGTVVGFTPMGKQPFVFDVRKCRLLQKASGDPLARTSAEGIAMSNWEGRTGPTLNNVQVRHLEARERCHSVSISAKGTDVLLGADWNVYCLDPAGGLKWRIPADTAWAVNIAGNDEVFVAAYTDGTIRWHRLSDGALLLTLFVHDDGKRWIVWTPNGYFAASEGGDELAGWHFNNGRDKAALFYVLSRFAEQFHRPDVIQRVLRYRSVEEALAEANRSKRKTQPSTDLAEFLPPVVTILSPQDRKTVEAERLELRLLISTVPRHPATEVRVLVNGKPAEGVRELRPPVADDGEEQRSLSLALASGEYDITVVAGSDAGLGDPAHVRVYYDRPATPRRNLNLLAVGISRYDAQVPALRHAAKDARDLAATMKAQKGKLYEEVAVCLLTDADATRAAVLEGLQWLRARTGAEDVSVIFLSGHEARDADGEPYYLPADTNLRAIDQTALPASAIGRTARELAGRTVILLDTGRQLREGEYGGIMASVSAAECGAIVLSASSGRQYPEENEQWVNGAFCRGLLEGLDGKADYTKDGQVTVNELEIYVRKRVKTLTGGAQIPAAARPMEARDFPLARAAQEK